jgi:hypothetical protein
MQAIPKDNGFEDIVKNTTCQCSGRACTGLSYCEYGYVSCQIKIIYGCFGFGKADQHV